MGRGKVRLREGRPVSLVQFAGNPISAASTAVLMLLTKGKHEGKINPLKDRSNLNWLHLAIQV